MLFTYGLWMGLESVVRGHITREVVKNIIVPVNYWRTLEFRIVLKELRPNQSDTILDIGSPKLLSLYLADKVGARVLATDIESYFIRDYEVFRSFRHIPEERLQILRADGRELQFSENSFDKVFSISVLEHIPEHGDIECVKEIARVLKPGGLCVLTVPFAPVSRDEFKDSKDFYWSGSSTSDAVSQKVFFQRRYDENDIHERLAKPSGLKLTKLLYLGETFPFLRKRELSEFLPPITGTIQPLMSTLFHAAPSKTWRTLKRPLGALIVLSK